MKIKICALCRSPKVAVEFRFDRKLFGVFPVKKIKYVCASCAGKMSQLIEDYKEQRGKKNKRGDLK